jgi:TonB family protein
MTRKSFVGFSFTAWVKRAAVLSCLLTLFGASSPVAVRAQGLSARKLITRVAPKYPEYLQTHEIGGVVRLNVTVTPSGNVKSIAPLGGNPILVDAATDAVKQWKYAPSDTSDTFEVKLEFTPRRQ